MSDFWETIQVDIHGWFPANMCSMLGAILYLFQRNLNNISINTEPSITTILEKNNFLSFFGHARISDTHNTTISYQMLNPNDHLFFNGYIFNEFLSKPDLPQMSPLLKKKIAESIYELFVNAQIHSHTEKIFTCGQHYPNKKEIEFMITDIGIGFKESVNRRFGANISSIQAIRWAMEEGHTTKEETSGGLGLSLLKEFIHKNNGKIQVISGDGYWEYSGESIIEQTFREPFPGTVINIRVRTDDPCQYRLKSKAKKIGNDLF